MSANADISISLFFLIVTAAVTLRAGLGIRSEPSAVVAVAQASDTGADEMTDEVSAFADGTNRASSSTPSIDPADGLWITKWKEQTEQRQYLIETPSQAKMKVQVFKGGNHAVSLWKDGRTALEINIQRRNADDIILDCPTVVAGNILCTGAFTYIHERSEAESRVDLAIAIITQPGNVTVKAKEKWPAKDLFKMLSTVKGFKSDLRCTRAGWMSLDKAGAAPKDPYQEFYDSEEEETEQEEEEEEFFSVSEDTSNDSTEAFDRFVGTWNYGRASSYTIVGIGSGQYSFKEMSTSGKSMSGTLEGNGEYLQGELKYSLGTPFGSIRLKFNATTGGIISNQRKPPGPFGNAMWGRDIPAQATDTHATATGKSSRNANLMSKFEGGGTDKNKKTGGLREEVQKLAKQDLHKKLKRPVKKPKEPTAKKASSPTPVTEPDDTSRVNDPGDSTQVREPDNPTDHPELEKSTPMAEPEELIPVTIENPTPAVSTPVMQVQRAGPSGALLKGVEVIVTVSSGKNRKTTTAATDENGNVKIAFVAGAKVLVEVKGYYRNVFTVDHSDCLVDTSADCVLPVSMSPVRVKLTLMDHIFTPIKLVKDQLKVRDEVTKELIEKVDATNCDGDVFLKTMFVDLPLRTKFYVEVNQNLNEASGNGKKTAYLRKDRMKIKPYEDCEFQMAVALM